MSEQTVNPPVPDLSPAPDAGVIRMIFDRIEQQLDQITAVASVIESGLESACKPTADFAPHSEWRLAQLLVEMTERRSELAAWRHVLLPNDAERKMEASHV